MSAASFLQRRTWLLALVTLILSIACSSDGSDGEPGAEGGASPTSAVGDGMLPLGVAWEPITVARFDGDGRVNRLVAVGDQLWMLGSTYHVPMAWRSSDAVTWTESVLPARPDGKSTIIDIVETPDGRLVGVGNFATRCQEYEAPGDYHYFERCQRFRPVVHLSDDGGTTWRTVEPPAMTPPDDHSSVMSAITVSEGELVAAVTVRGDDWHGRIFTSTDGETWTLASQVRGDDEPWSVENVLSDGETIVVLASAHPCSTPHDISEAGWVLGSAWPSHLRILSGGDPAALTLLAPGEHPFAAAPMAMDCEADREIDRARLPYAQASGAVVNGEITLLERGAEDDDPDAESYARRVVTLTDGTWQTVGTMDLRPQSLSDWLVGAPEAPALLTHVGNRGRAIASIAVHLPDGTGSWTEHEGAPLLIASQVGAGGSFQGALLAAGVLHDHPFRNLSRDNLSGEFVLWRSVPVAASEWLSCEPAPGATCRGVDVGEATGRRDFSGLDLAGIDLTLASLGGSIFDGANLAGARLVAVEGLIASFVDANLTGADLRGARLGDLGGADLTNANLEGTLFGLSSAPASLDGASLLGATLSLERRDGEYPRVELSLAGMDLTDAQVRGSLNGEALMVITDLRGATLANTRFAAVDLSQAQVSGVHLSGLRLDEDSICPGGRPPVIDSLFGVCE